MSHPSAPDRSDDVVRLPYGQLLARSIEELRLKTAAHDQLWHIGEADWAVDQDAGTLTFTRAGAVIATCPVQIIGTYNTQDGTWLWGWDHPSVVPALQAHARAVYAYGMTSGIERLTSRTLACSESEAWEFTALACHLCGAQGAYRGPSGTVLVFMTFGEVTLRSATLPISLAEPIREASSLDAPDDDALVRLVRAFIADYAVWNDEAFRRDEQGEGSAWAEAAYGELIARYCQPGVVTQPLTFGSQSLHAPAHETITSVRSDNATASVMTRHVDPHIGFSSDYEYQLVKVNSRWYLERLRYHDADGAYDCL